jgi:hypothetical protein
MPLEGEAMAVPIAQIDGAIKGIPGNISSNPVMVQMFSSVAIRLWNIAVTKCSSPGMDSHTNAKGTQSLQMRVLLNVTYKNLHQRGA